MEHFLIAVVGHGRYRRDRVSLKIRLRQGQTLAALWHVHGANGPERTLFSPTDVDLANSLHVPVYLTNAAGFIRRLDPFSTVRQKPEYNRVTALRPPLGSSPGESIGHMHEGFAVAEETSPQPPIRLSSTEAYARWTAEGKPYGFGE